MGSNLFLTPNLFNKVDELPGDPKKRTTDIFIRRSQSECDTLEFNLPENVVISSVPKDITIESEFGVYKTTLISSNNKISYVRYFELKKGSYPKNRIYDFYDFFDQVKKADRQRIALKVQ
jgi:hypothetical protein